MIGSSDKLLYNELEMYPHHQTCILANHQIILTRTEFSILTILMEKKGCVISIKEFAAYVWPDEAFVDCKDVIAVHVHHLRKKMNDTQKPYSYIRTVWGKGYIMG